MNFTDTFIKRPVLATVLSLIILLIGIVCYFKVTLRQFPEINATVLNVTTVYPGASAKLMEGFVTTPLEMSIASVNGIDFMSSSSTQGKSTITIQFKLNYDINTAIADINSAVSSARWQLPKNVNDPIVQKQDPNALPVVWIAFSNPNMNAQQITDYLTRVVQPRLQAIDGVGSAQIFGARQYAMRIWLNPQAMMAHGVAASDVKNALQSNNLQTPTGRLKNDFNQFDIDANTGLNNAEQFNNLVIVDQNQQHITRIKDIGQAKLGAQNDDSSSMLNGKQSIFIGATAKSTGNPLAIAKEIEALLTELKSELPTGMKAINAWDNSKFIAASIREVKWTIIEATFTVIFIIFVFLGSLRALTISMVSIPLSLIGAFGLMAAFGFTINTLTLLALVLAIGMVVDDAIVVSENIHRHIEQGKTPLEAALVGTREIQFAVLAITFTLAAVFAPIGFMSGLTGILFREFAFTLAGTVIISGFIALTLSPMMCSKLFRAKTEETKLEKIINHTTTIMTKYYHNLLVKSLTYRKWIMGFMLIILTTIAILYYFIPKELAPKEDIGAVMAFISGPANSNLQYTEKYTQAVGKIFASVPETIEYGAVNGFPNGVNSGIVFTSLKPWEHRKRSVDQIIGSLFPQFMGLTGVNAFPLNPYSLPGATGFMPIDFVLETTGSFSELKQAIDKLRLAASTNPALANVDINLNYDKTEINVDINRDRAAILGVSMNDIGDLLSIAFGQPVVSQFEFNGRGYDVIPQVMSEFRSEPDDIGNLPVRTASHDLIPLANMAKISQTNNPRGLNHFQQLRAASLTASIAPGHTMGEALTFLKQEAQKIMTPQMRYDFSGEARQFVSASSSMAQTFIFALIFIFLILAAQFESFRSPLVVMCTVPLSTLGALMLLKVTGSTMNIYTEIGIVTLIGLISKHGILMVEFANQLQTQGYTRTTAIIEAASVRFRPILMTTMAMILGAVPLTLSVGAGAISRSQMGWTIIGGMTIGTIFTLFVVPTIYTLLATSHIPVEHSAAANSFWLKLQGMIRSRYSRIA